MGSWNATCQISQLPIEYGTPVRFLLLVKNNFAMDGFQSKFNSLYSKNQEYGLQPNSRAAKECCLSSDFWQPDFVPIRASYNSYGTVEDFDTSSLAWELWQEKINERLIELKGGPDPIHDLVVKKNMKLEQLLFALRNGRLHFRDLHTENGMLPVCQTMIREDVYQEFLKLKLSAKISQKAMYRDALKIFAKENIDKMEFLEPGEKGRIFSLLTTPAASNIENTFSCMLHWREGQYFVDYINSGRSTEDKKFKKFLKDIVEFYYVCSVFSCLRKTWHPGSGCGSQDFEIELSQDYFQKMASLSASIKRDSDLELDG